LTSLGQEQERAIEEASRLIHESRYVIALGGAGMSVESGIPPFRGPGGRWTIAGGEPDPRSYQRFLEDPVGHWQNRLNQDAERRGGGAWQSHDAARPNRGHHALVELEEMGILKYIITQNTDNLHREAGSRNLAEIHGNRRKLRCIECGLRWMREDFQIRELPPRCPECRGLIKADIVTFGEPIPRDVLPICFEQTEMCDCMLIIGTSALVYPAAGFPPEAKMRGARLIEVNIGDTPLTHLCDLALRGQSGEILPRLVEHIKTLPST
jgi:NAD-dependent deacetylase